LLRPHPRHPRRELRGTGGRHRHHPGLQRRGQDHPAEDGLGRHGSAEGQRAVRRPRDPAHGPRQGDAAWHQPCARGPRSLSVPLGAREFADGRLHTARYRRGGQGPRGGVRLLPGAQGARRAARRLAFGRRAADAVDQPSADGAAQGDAARRALARPVAQAGAGHLRHHRAHQPRARRHHPAGRAERQHGAAGRRLRLRARSRPHRHGRHVRATGGKRGHQGVLSRHQAAGCARPTALEEAEDLEMTTMRIEVEGCDTIPKLFWHQVKARAGRTAFREKHLGIWRSTSWTAYGERARWTGMGLVKLGLNRGDVVSILAETIPEWLYADMGTMGAGGVSNGIYPTDSAKQVEYILGDSRSRFLFVEDEEQLDKFLEVRGRCPDVIKVFVFDMEGLSDFRDKQVMPFDELVELGRVHDEANPGLWERLVAESKAEDLALLVYTSGTTGPPKGSMLAHRNVIFQLINADAFIPVVPDGEQLAFLPLCHIAERTFTSFLPLRTGAIANFAESVETVPENVREVAPTIFFAVPRIWERFYSGIAIRMREATWIGRTAYRWALGIGLTVAEAELDARRP